MIKFYIIVVFIWITLLVLAFTFRKSKFGKILKPFAYTLFLLLTIEFAALVGFKIKLGFWIFKEKPNQNAELFEPHPYLVGMPKKDVTLDWNGITYSHNNQGFRGKLYQKENDKLNILCIGGSTTYCIGVNENETWPYYLDSLLPFTNIVNFGIPGHSTVEHIHLASFIIPAYKPDLVIVHCGLNDIRNMHIKNLEPDYSNFHAPTLFGSLGFCYVDQHPKIATVKLLTILLQKIGYMPLCEYHKMHVEGTESKEIDNTALSFYQQNIRTLDAIFESQNVKVVFVPQIMLEESIEGGKYKWWAPYVPDDVFVEQLNIYNKSTKDIALTDSMYFINSVLDSLWEKSDFADPSHLNANGNLKFAKIIAKELNTLLTKP